MKAYCAKHSDTRMFIIYYIIVIDCSRLTVLSVFRPCTKNNNNNNTSRLNNNIMVIISRSIFQFSEQILDELFTEVSFRFFLPLRPRLISSLISAHQPSQSMVPFLLPPMQDENLRHLLPYYNSSTLLLLLISNNKASFSIPAN